ncbi:MAG: glycosyltransferase family 2 protein [Candidatus Sumerlaeota bacterium]|nr:glycosyltransferase family 2 protein [Candidatus Sumerlaeota bacterium]
MIPRVLAIIITWNKREMLDRMLASLRSSTDMPFDAVVIDNASTDGTGNMIRQKHPWVEVIRNEVNLGGTGGFNCGMRHGLNHPKNYDFFWLLDNDVIVHKGALEALLAPALADLKVGLVGSAILLLSDPSYVQEAGANVIWSSGGLERQGEGPIDDTSKSDIKRVDYCAACSLLARVEAIRKVGLWDPGYFVFWDDIDWGVRFNRAGWLVVAARRSLVEHESYFDRRAMQSPAGTYLCVRNAIYCYHRYAPALCRPMLFFAHYRRMITVADNAEAKGALGQARATRRAVADFLDGRMGRPPAELDAADPYAREAEPLSGLPAGAAHVRRAALFARDNAEFARRIHARLREFFPDAVVETLALNPSGEIKKESLPDMRVVRIDSIFQRLALAAAIGLKYDVVAAPEFFQHFFFENFAARSLRFRGDLTFTETRRGAARIARLVWRRLTAWPRAAWLTMRTLVRPREHVDYFDYGMRKINEADRLL